MPQVKVFINMTGGRSENARKKDLPYLQEAGGEGQTTRVTPLSSQSQQLELS